MVRPKKIKYTRPLLSVFVIDCRKKETAHKKKENTAHQLLMFFQPRAMERENWVD